MLTDETIRKIFEDERNSPGLTRLSDDFFEQVREYLEKKGMDLDKFINRVDKEALKVL